jgi:hypothetical protein
VQLENLIRTLGFRSDTGNCLAALDIFVCLHYGTVGLTVLEAL